MTLAEYRNRYRIAPKGERKRRWEELRAATAAALAGQHAPSYGDARGAGVK